MNIAEPFIRRPVMTTLVMVSILVFGIIAYRLLPVSELPNVDFPTIQVTASLPGASPETMASSVATPLERQFTTIAGLDSMTSSSTQDNTQITLQFALNRDIDAAAQDVQTAISRAVRQLPRDMPNPPTYRKVNPADQPIIYLALTSDTLPVSELNEYGETMMAQRISTISGVAQVNVYGSQKYAVRIQVDPLQLKSRGIGIDQVAQAVSRANVNLPTGLLQAPERAFTIETSGQLFSADAYRPIIVAYQNGAPVRLEQVASVIDSVENDKTAAWYADKERNSRAVVLAVQRQPGTNTIEIAQAVRRLLPTFQARLPAAAQLKVLYDRSVPIEESVNDVKFTLGLTIALVVMVIFVFLRNLPATIIPSLAVPFSLIGTFAIMYLCGYNLDNISLMALTLSVGFVVDDAIVMLENIVRHIEKGERPFKAALIGSAEVGFTILSMTISLAAVFIPILFMGGIVGRLFQEFAVTIGTAVLFSGFVSLTLTPLLCARYLKAESHRSHGRFYERTEAMFDASVNAYGRSLRWSFGHQGTMLLLSAVLFVITVFAFVKIPKGFLPTDDFGQIFATVEGNQGISFTQLRENQITLTNLVRQNPYVEAMFSSAGARGGSSSANTGIFFLRLTHGNRPHASEIINDLRAQLSTFPGIRAFLQIPPSIRIGGQLTKSLYQFTIQSPDFDELHKFAPLMEEKMAALPLLQDVTSDLQIRNPQLQVDIQRDKAAALGLSAEQIEDTLFYAYGSRQISTIFAPNNQYNVILEIDPRYQGDPNSISQLYVRSDTGALVPLSAVASLRSTVGPLSVSHQGQLPSVTISFNTKPGVALGEATAAVEAVARDTLPASMNISFQGTAQAFQSSIQGLGLLLLVSIFVIYVVLGILYESFVHPVTILTALPFAGLGALATLWLFGRELDIYAFVGVIMLVGLVKKNGIMMIDFALEAEKHGEKNPEKAIFDACIVRFRPIMMTTMAALLGALPLALGIGAGAESRRPLGLAVVGGLLFSQTLTLYITPIFFLYMERLRHRFKGRSYGEDEETIPEH